MLLFHCYKLNHGACNRCTHQVRGEMNAAGAMRGSMVKHTDLSSDSCLSVLATCGAQTTTNLCSCGTFIIIFTTSCL